MEFEYYNYIKNLGISKVKLFEQYMNLILFLSVLSTFFIFMSIVPYSDAHKLIIASNGTPQIDNELESTVNALLSKGYNVLLLTSAMTAVKNTAGKIMNKTYYNLKTI